MRHSFLDQDMHRAPLHRISTIYIDNYGMRYSEHFLGENNRRIRTDERRRSDPQALEQMIDLEGPHQRLRDSCGLSWINPVEASSSAMLQG